MREVGDGWGAASVLALLALLTLEACGQDERQAGAVGRPDVVTVEADRAVVQASLTQALSRAPENLQMQEHADGGRHVRIVGGFQHATVLVRSDAGLQTHCLGDAAEATRLLEGSAR